MNDIVKAISKFDKLYYSHDEIIAIYAEALEHETGIPASPDLHKLVDFDAYNIEFDSDTDKVILYIKGVHIQFEVENETVICVNYMDSSGWYIDTSREEPKSYAKGGESDFDRPSGF